MLVPGDLWLELLSPGCGVVVHALGSETAVRTHDYTALMGLAVGGVVIRAILKLVKSVAPFRFRPEWQSRFFQHVTAYFVRRGGIPPIPACLHWGPTIVGLFRQRIGLCSLCHLLAKRLQLLFQSAKQFHVLGN